MNDQRFLRDWVKALKSGEYKQGKGFLYKSESDSYCCLGVGCVIVGLDKKQIDSLIAPDKPNLPNYLTADIATFFACLNDGENLTRDFEVTHYAYDLCVEHNIGKHNEDSGIVELRPHSFEEIADIIEKIFLNEITQ